MQVRQVERSQHRTALLMARSISRCAHLGPAEGVVGVGARQQGV